MALPVASGGCLDKALPAHPPPLPTEAEDNIRRLGVRSRGRAITPYNLNWSSGDFRAKALIEPFKSISVLGKWPKNRLVGITGRTGLLKSCPHPAFLKGLISLVPPRRNGFELFVCGQQFTISDKTNSRETRFILHIALQMNYL
jgi:hypothetical protein